MKIMRIGFVILAIAILVLSLVPVPVTQINITNIDKVQHFFAYAILAFFGIMSFSTCKKPFGTIAVAVLIIAYGILIEWLQQYTGRELSFLDALANMIGVIFGVIVAKTMPKRNTPH